MYGTIWFPNASNGQFFILAALLMWSLVANWGLSPFLAAVVVIAGSIPFSLILEKFLVRPFYNVPNRNIVYFIMTLGLAQIFAGAFTCTYGRWSDQYSLPATWPGVIMLGPFPFPRTRLLVLLIALILLAGLFAFLRLHRIGRALRAVFQNREAAILRGVDVRRIYRFSFVLAMLIITTGGVLFALAYAFDLTMAWNMAIIAFAIMIVGGPGSVLGSVVIGMIFGFTQAAVSLFASPTLAAFSYLIVMLIILLVKPSGLFAR
jgi:branched-chain amino acid transport system permease protein